MDENRREQLQQIIEVEMELLVTNKIPLFQDDADIVVAVSSLADQLYTCYTTTTLDHSLKLVKRATALCYTYFQLNGESLWVKPRPHVSSFGQGLINLKIAVENAENAIGREARGDARSHLMNVLSILTGLLNQFLI